MCYCFIFSQIFETNDTYIQNNSTWKEKRLIISKAEYTLNTIARMGTDKISRSLVEWINAS